MGCSTVLDTLMPLVRCRVCRTPCAVNTRFTKTFLCSRCQKELGVKTFPELEKKRVKEARQQANKEKIRKAKEAARQTPEAKKERKKSIQKLLGRGDVANS